MSSYIHHEYPKTDGRKDFWKQIKRTVNGQEVSPDDIKIIIKNVSKGLMLSKSDTVLDLGCGNAALASYFYKKINRYHGVDFSKYLLEIANDFFYISELTTFQELDLGVSPESIHNLQNYNKVLMYGVASYFSKRQLCKIFETVLINNENVQRIYIGNVPNVNFSDNFFARRNLIKTDLKNPNSSIGVWWDPDEISQILISMGYSCKIFLMPKDFYGYPYRFDILAMRNE